MHRFFSHITKYGQVLFIICLKKCSKFWFCSIGIFDKLVDGRYTLLDNEKRKNGFVEDQIEAYKIFMKSADIPSS